MARHVTRRGQSPEAEGGHRGSSGVASIAPRESKIRPDHAPESPQQIGSMISLLSPLPPPSLFPPAVVSAPDELVRGFAVGVVWMASKQLQLGFACTDLSLHSTAQLPSLLLRSPVSLYPTGQHIEAEPSQHTGRHWESVNSWMRWMVDGRRPGARRSSKQSGGPTGAGSPEAEPRAPPIRSSWLSPGHRHAHGRGPRGSRSEIR